VTKTDFENLTARLNKSYKAWKKAESDKNKEKDNFFRLAIENLKETETLAQVIVQINLDVEDVEQWILDRYPRWRIVDIDRDKSTALIEEDPYFKDFLYTNSESNLVFERKIVDGGQSLDDDRLKSENPELWERITEETRVLRPLESLKAEDLALVQEYIILGKPQVKLQAPRKAKAEDLEES
jgi:hypothetical protein